MKFNFILFNAFVLVCAIGLSCTTTRDIRIGSAFDESQPAKPADIREAINKGTLFLINTQNRDGSWGSFESAVLARFTLEQWLHMMRSGLPQRHCAVWHKWKSRQGGMTNPDGRH